MSFRFTDTEKWKDKWFRKLKAPEKLLFMYLMDNCDMAGFIEIDTEFWAYQTCMKEDHVTKAVTGLGAGCVEADGWIWVRGFLRMQRNENLSQKNKCYATISSLIKDQHNRFMEHDDFNMLYGAYMGHISPIKPTKEKAVVGVKAKPKGLAEVAEYFRGKLGESDAVTESARYFDHFNSNGWLAGGKSPMKDWKAAANGWIRNYNENRFGTLTGGEGGGSIKMGG